MLASDANNKLCESPEFGLATNANNPNSGEFGNPAVLIASFFYQEARSMYPKLTNRGDVLAMLDEMLAFRQKMIDLCTKLTVEQLNDPVYPGTWSVLKNLAHLANAELYMLAHIKSRPAAPGEGVAARRSRLTSWRPSAPPSTRPTPRRSPSSRRTRNRCSRKNASLAEISSKRPSVGYISTSSSTKSVIGPSSCINWENCRENEG